MPRTAPAASEFPEPAASGRLARGGLRQEEMLGAVDVGLWYCDLPFDELMWDARVKAHFWLPPDARVTIDTFYDRIHPDDRADTRSAIERSIAERSPYDIEYRTVAPDDHARAGAVRWVRAIGYTGYDAADRPVRFDGVTVDVTTTKRTEAALAASEARLRLALDVAGLGTWEIDLRDGSGFLDPRAAEIVGLPSGAFADVAAAQATATHPDDLASLQQAVAAGIRSGVPFELEYRVIAQRHTATNGNAAMPDGPVRHVLSRALALPDANGRPVRLVGTNRDVTAEREAAAERARLVAALEEERDRLRQAFDQAPGFVGVVRGAEHRFEYANLPFLEISGHRPLLGRTVRDAFPDVAAQGFFELLDQVYTTGEPFVGRALPAVLQPLPDGPVEHRRVDFTYQPLTELGPDGLPRVTGILIQGRDVTAEAAARDTLAETAAERERLLAASEAARADAERARAAAEEANRAKAAFLATMSHELRTPLNAIGGYAELLQLGLRGPVTAAQIEDLERIARAQQHLLGLINGVLNYAKLDAGAVHYTIAAVPLGEVLHACEALVAPQARARGVRLVHHAVPPTVRVRADAEKLQQVLLNLLSNAIKFTEVGGEVLLTGQLVGVGVVEVTVADTGIGIAADQLPRIFEPFVQVDTAYTRAQGGTGLGLAISRDLARGMGGDLTVSSRPGDGSTFTLTLPDAT